MKTIKLYIMLSMLTIPVLFSGILAEERPPAREALLGIERLGVQIGEISSTAKAVGIERKYLRTNIELKLQSKGITIVGNNDLESNKEIPYLLVTVLLSYSEPTYSYVVMVGLNEKVHLARDPKMTPNAMAWWRIMKGKHLGNPGLLKEIDKTLIQLLDEFCNDYFAVNSPGTNNQSISK
jgi:hypothetical protein